ncbi:D-alanyl-D-alanine carboxypeptidase/D-alanyl-D-alanine-endopeptidase [Synechococcus sp. PCC 6312]|uniref:D-alanyl-D-alanine carboxypeptidase/D-alanyl-D-alanine endopeptidase n=1 Tax=Synechococcus sp. (strain ATCC 27167 / PCC 6312) TaxID=195253 RepID=UPI00155A7882|nr:D-alanyl-D-alanine carboxypeptidase/D-alanyl-D-alanine-endopeptidase [Synechococcus sp. PCC 6312]
MVPTPIWAICPANLSKNLDALVTTPAYAQGQWGIAITTLNDPNGSRTPDWLYTYKSNQRFLVASNLKLITTAATLAQFGPNYQLSTQVFGEGAGADWAWVRLVGGGDPSLKTSDLEKMAQSLWQQGIRHIDTLEITSLPFADPPLNPTWSLADVADGEIAPITRLALNRNALPLVVTPQELNKPLHLAWTYPELSQDWQIVNQTRTVATSDEEFIDTKLDEAKKIVRVMGQLRVGSEPEPVDIPLLNPYPYILNQWRAALSRVGIQINRVQIQNSPSRPMGQRLYSLSSPPLTELINQTNRQSDNFYAETLKQVTATIQPSQITQILSTWGLASNSYHLEDGSGLSRANWVTPQALIQLLQMQRLQPYWPVFQNSLPQAGVNGTLKNRFKNTIAQGTIWAKTGTLEGVAALSGYAYPPNFSPLVFSIVVNQSNVEGSSLRPRLDRIALEMMKLQACP